MIRLSMMFGLFALIGLIGCGGSGSSGGKDEKKDDGKSASIVGTWEGANPDIKDSKIIVTFTADGKCSMEMVPPELPKEAKGKVTFENLKIEGTYKLADKALTLAMGGKEKVMTIKELSDAKLVMQNPEKVDLTLTKKK